MSDARLWWMLNLLGLLVLSAAVFGFLGWWLRMIVTRDRSSSQLHPELKKVKEQLADMETELHEAEGALRRCEAELAECRLQATQLIDPAQMQALKDRLAEPDAEQGLPGLDAPAKKRRKK